MRVPKSRVELHLHLDGSPRHTTIWELASKKGVSLPGSGTLDDLRRSCVVKEPRGLLAFLERFDIFLPLIKGDVEAIERIAYELCEDEAQNGIIYFETRYSPQYLVDEGKGVTVDHVVQSVNKGLKRGEKDFGLQARSILCCITEHPEWSREVVTLASRYKEDGVVGIDLAGDEMSQIKDGVVSFHPQHVEAFKEAVRLGVHRTVHAGEMGPATVVEAAVDQLFAERIGHGYHVLEDNTIYKRMFNLNMHFEMCPHSSLLTGAVPVCCDKHPIVRLAEDGANFSVNSDDPTVTGRYVGEDYELVWKWGLTERHLVNATFNAALASFLPDSDKQALIAKLCQSFGIPRLLEPLSGPQQQGDSRPFTLPLPEIKPRVTSQGSPIPSPIGSPVTRRKPNVKISSMKEARVVGSIFD